MPAGVFAVALALGLFRLGALPLSFDEEFTRDTATRSWSGIWDAARDTEAPHLVYYALMKPWLAVFGESDWALRLPSGIFGAFAAGATAILGRRLFGELAGLVAGLALATSSYFVYWSQAARGYTLAVLLATVATYAFVRLRAAIDGVVGDLGGCPRGSRLVNVFAFSVVAAHFVAFLLFSPRPPIRAPVIAACAGLAAFLPQLVLVVSGDNGQLDWIPTPTPYRVAVGLWDLASRNPIAVFAAAIGIAQLVRSVVPQAATWKSALVMVWLGAPLAATLLASIAQPAFEARYVLVGLPALALAIGAALVYIPRRRALALGIALVLSASIRLGQHYWAPGEGLFLG